MMMVIFSRFLVWTSGLIGYLLRHLINPHDNINAFYIYLLTFVLNFLFSLFFLLFYFCFVLGSTDSKFNSHSKYKLNILLWGSRIYNRNFFRLTQLIVRFVLVVKYLILSHQSHDMTSQQIEFLLLLFFPSNINI